MNLEWILLAEGFGSDSKGAPTAIGINQNVILAPTLPAQTKRGVMACFGAAPDEVGAELTVIFDVKSPKGNTLSAQTVQATVGQSRWKDVPVNVNFSAEVNFHLTEWGAHTFTVAVQTPGGKTARGSVELYVVNPEENNDS